MVDIVITELQFKKAESTFRAASDFRMHVVPADEGIVASAIREHGARAAVLGVEPYGGELYQALPTGGTIARFGVGHDGIDKQMATAAGLHVTNTPGVLEEAVAEHTLALLLGLAKNLITHHESLRSGRWQPLSNLELRGGKMAVIGFGAIGKRVSRAAHFGLGMRVIGVDCVWEPTVPPDPQWGASRMTDDFAQAVAGTMVVSVHIPGSEENRHFINSERLAAIPDGAFLINTSRGCVVDEEALHDALSSGRLGGAALDVFENEPYEPVNPAKDIRQLPKVLLTPHVSSGTAAACTRVGEAVLRNIRNVLAGDLDQVDLVNSDLLRR